MNCLFFAMAVVSTQVAGQVAEPVSVTVQYAQTTIGRTVSISLDGKPARSEFAGKLGFRDRDSSWTSVCADIRSPVEPGSFFAVQVQSSTKTGGNIALAGNIVGRYFKEAQTPDECAGLQLAVWEAIEDGGAKPDFGAGKFRVKATDAVLHFAQEYYGALDEPSDVIFLQVRGGQGGPGSGPGGGQRNGGGGQGQLLIS